MQDTIEKKLRRLIESTAAAFGAKAEVSYELKTPALICKDEIITRMKESFAKSIGAENVRMIPEPSSGSEDFSQYSLYTDLGYCKIGTHGEDPLSELPNHSPRVLQDEKSIPTAIAGMAGYVLDRLGAR